MVPLGSCDVIAIGFPRIPFPHSQALLRLWARSSQNSLNGILTGMAFYTPVPNMSLLDLTCFLEKSVKYNYIKKVAKHASEGPLKGILDYTDDQVVS